MVIKQEDFTYINDLNKYLLFLKKIFRHYSISNKKVIHILEVAKMFNL